MREVEDSMMSVQQKNSAYFVGTLDSNTLVKDYYLRFFFSFLQNGSQTMSKLLIVILHPRTLRW